MYLAVPLASPTRHFNDIQNTIHNDATITVAMRCKLANYSSRAG